MTSTVLTNLRVGYKNRVFIWLPKFRKLSYVHNIGTEPLKPLTLGKLLEETCKNNGDVTAVISRSQKQSLSFTQLLNQADSLAAGLRRIGLNPGDRLGLWAPNLLEWYVTKFACARAGITLVALNPAYQPREIEYCIKKVGISSIICPDKFKTQNYYEILNVVAPELSASEPGKLSSRNVPSLESVIMISNLSFKGAYNFEEVIKLSDQNSVNSIRKNQDLINMDDPCNIQFTSGTTGHPKAAVLSHFHMVNNGYNSGKRTELHKEHHVICCQPPLFHVFGTVIGIAGSLNHAATMVLPSPGFNPDDSLDAIKEEKCTVIYGTPTMYVDLVKRQEERKLDISPRIAVYGGASCPANLRQKVLETLKVQTIRAIYGLSESTAVNFQSLPGDDEYKTMSTVGYVSDHTEAKVIDEQGRIVPRGVQGELCLRGYSTMLGYWGDEEKTLEVIGADRWLKTGDQFILEGDGYGRIVGRLKEMIIRGGENIFPKEIEDLLSTHPDIIEIHVIGLPHERLGEEVCACIRVRQGKSVTLDDIKTFCKGNIAHFKIPSALKVVDVFPKTTSGKIQKFKLVQEFVEQSSVN